jgi:hypothetical protein
MRALWSVVVLCLVAASGAAVHPDAAAEPVAAAVVAVAAVVHQAGRAEAPTARHTWQGATGRARAQERRLPSVALAFDATLPAPEVRATVLLWSVCEVVAAAPTRTGSARGPPIV